MLPDFTKAKARANRDLSRWANEQIRAVEPLLQGVSTTRQHEGKAGRIVRADETEASIDFCSVSSEFVQNREELKHSSIGTIQEKLLKVTKEIARAQVRQILAATGAAAESVGNVVDAEGELTQDKYLDMFRKIEMNFDPRTLQPSRGTTLVMHPELAASVVPKLKQWETDREFKAEYDRIIAAKREEWRDREANRKLVD